MWLKYALLVVGLLCLLGEDVPYPSLVRSVSAVVNGDDEESNRKNDSTGLANGGSLGNQMDKSEDSDDDWETEDEDDEESIVQADAGATKPEDATSKANQHTDASSVSAPTSSVASSVESSNATPEVPVIGNTSGSTSKNDEPAKEGEDNNNKKKSGFGKQLQKIKNAFRRGSKKEHSHHKGHKSHKHQGSTRPSWRERLRARFQRGKKQKKVAVSESRENLIDSNEANASSASNSDPAGEGVVPANEEGTHEGNAHHQDVSTTEKNKKHGKHKNHHKKPWSKLFRRFAWKRTKKSDVAETRAAVQEGTNVTEPTPAPVTAAPSSRLGGGESSSETNKVDAESTNTAEGLGSSEPNPSDDAKSGSKRIPKPSSNLNGSERPSQHRSASSTME